MSTRRAMSIDNEAICDTNEREKEINHLPSSGSTISSIKFQIGVNDIVIAVRCQETKATTERNTWNYSQEMNGVSSIPANRNDKTEKSSSIEAEWDQFRTVKRVKCERSNKRIEEKENRLDFDRTRNYQLKIGILFSRCFFFFSVFFRIFFFVFFFLPLAQNNRNQLQIEN